MNVNDVEDDVAEDLANTTVGAVAAIVTVIEDGDPDEMLVCGKEPVPDTEKLDARVNVLTPDEPGDEIVEVAFTRHTLEEIFATDIEEMLVRSKSTPDVVEIVAQLI